MKKLLLLLIFVAGALHFVSPMLKADNPGPGPGPTPTKEWRLETRPSVDSSVNDGSEFVSITESVIVQFNAKAGTEGEEKEYHKGGDNDGQPTGNSHKVPVTFKDGTTKNETYIEIPLYS